jgi:hypothetical protein
VLLSSGCLRWGEDDNEMWLCVLRVDESVVVVIVVLFSQQYSTVYLCKFRSFGP